jgi:hypothetical protein
VTRHEGQTSKKRLKDEASAVNRGTVLQAERMAFKGQDRPGTEKKPGEEWMGMKRAVRACSPAPLLTGLMGPCVLLCPLYTLDDKSFFFFFLL